MLGDSYGAGIVYKLSKAELDESDRLEEIENHNELDKPNHDTSKLDGQAQNALDFENEKKPDGDAKESEF